MATSGAAVAMLLFLLLIGPLLYLAVYLYQNWKAKQAGEQRPVRKASSWAGVSEEAAGGEGAREEVKSIDYLLGLIGYAIGIGNVWRFPYLVGKYGGGAFVFAYLVCLFFVAAPLYLMELILGQATQKSTIMCYNMIRPRWRSLGWGQAIMLFFVISYYNVLLAYTMNYIYYSLQDPLPWTVLPEALTNLTSPASFFWRSNVLNKYDPLGVVDNHTTDVKEHLIGQPLGGVQGNLAGGLFVVWLIVFFALAFGKDVLAKVTYVTVVGPVVLMVIMVFQTTQMEGAGEGIKFYIGKFEGKQLANLDLWATACGLILFSLSPGCGTAITMSSYVKPKEDVFRTCLIVMLANSAFSIFSGFAIFSVLGNLASTTGQTMEEIASTSGTGLAFIAIAQGITSFGSSANVMAVLFFIMLLTLGLDSTFAWAETFICYVEDMLVARGKPLPKWQIVLGVCVMFFLAGLPYCTRMGNELLDVVDRFVASYYLLFGCFLEAVMVFLDVGFDRIQAALLSATIGNARTPNGRRLHPAMKGMFFGSVPLFCLVLFLVFFANDASEQYEGYPAGLNGFGWAMLVLLLLVTPATMWQKTPGTLQPWGPNTDAIVLEDVGPVAEMTRMSPPDAAEGGGAE